jgi:hypothetical protein
VSGPDGVPLEGVPALRVLDVVPPVRVERLRQLQDIHARHFPDYLHVVDELEQDWRDGAADPAVVVHQLLLLHEDEPVGEFIVHTNLRRGIVLRHYLAVDEPARPLLRPGWVTHLVDAVAELGRRDAAAAARPLLAMTSEVQEHHLAGWRRLGHRPLDIGYAEPRWGKHWRDHGPVQMLPITPVVALLPDGRVRPDGSPRPFAEVAHAGVTAFLVDHYRLPPDHPEVAAILARAAALPD